MAATLTTIKAADILDVLGEDFGQEVVDQINSADDFNCEGAFVCDPSTALGLIEDNCDEDDFKKAEKLFEKFEKKNGNEDFLVVINADTLPG